jgi:hypothetical protein
MRLREIERLQKRRIEHLISLHYSSTFDILSENDLEKCLTFVGMPSKKDIEFSKKKYQDNPQTEAYDRRVRGKNWKKAKSVGLVSGRTSPNSLIRKGYKI